VLSGLDENIVTSECRKVNELVDRGSLHDVGRRRAVSVTADPLKRALLREVEQSFLTGLRLDYFEEKAYYLHHLLDVAYMLVSKLPDYSFWLEWKSKLVEHLSLHPQLYFTVLNQKTYREVLSFFEKEFESILRDLTREAASRVSEHNPLKEKLYRGVLRSELERGDLDFTRLRLKLRLVNKIFKMYPIRSKEDLVNRLSYIIARFEAGLTPVERAPERGSELQRDLRDFVTFKDYLKLVMRAQEEGYETIPGEAWVLAGRAINELRSRRALLDELRRVLSRCMNVDARVVKVYTFFLNQYLQAVSNYVEEGVWDPETAPVVAYILAFEFLLHVALLLLTGTSLKIPEKCVEDVVKSLKYPYPSRARQAVEDFRDALKLLKHLAEEL